MQARRTDDAACLALSSGMVGNDGMHFRLQFCKCAYGKQFWVQSCCDPKIDVQTVSIQVNHAYARLLRRELKLANFPSTTASGLGAGSNHSLVIIAKSSESHYGGVNSAP